MTASTLLVKLSQSTSRNQRMDRRYRLRTATLALIVLLAGCVGVPFDAPKFVSYALDDTADTYLGRLVAPAAAKRPDQSGFYLLRDGIEALAARLILSERTERSIDAQYYLMLNDITGQLFVWQLLRAADRGVRVRLLLDDISTGGYESGMTALASHPNTEIRLFNPFARGLGSSFKAAVRFQRINRRMHNKSMIFDNQAVIVGGRNIGAEYFSARKGSNYNDLDLLGLGPVAQDVSTAFDRYWNSTMVVPVSAMLDTKTAAADLQALRTRLDDIAARARQTPYGEALTSTIVESVAKGDDTLTWSGATVVADPSGKAREDYVNGDPKQLSSVFGPVIREAQRELIVVSPYFVPGRKGVGLFRELISRGVQVLILTNSLAANDVTAVHSGYARYRESLLKAGVELWEMRRDPARPDRRRRGLGYSLSSLHAKAFVLDRRHLFIGSFN